VAIKRPSNLIGFSSNIEFVNFKFRIDSVDVSEGEIISNVPIQFQSHNQPLTQKKAQTISGSNEGFPESIAVFGCGALGSKIIMHFGRSGRTGFTLIDPDYLSPHNLVRHALTSGDVGSNKAFGLAESIRKMYPTETLGKLLNAPSFKEEAFYQSETFKVYNWILDFTASEAFFNKLVLAKNMNDSHICSASISDFGNLGIMLKEGQNRNPRIDDL
jgi:tRNA A37 threonylcarbamoyladenosine dehydratase